LKHVGIDIRAYSQEARGRSGMFATLPDRPIEELAKVGLTDIEAVVWIRDIY
jgi:hypothetical protein